MIARQTADCESVATGCSASLMLHTQTKSGIKFVYDVDMRKLLYIFNPIVCAYVFLMNAESE